MEQFSIGRVLSRSSGMLRDNLASVGLFMLIIQIVSSGAEFLAQGQLPDLMPGGGTGASTGVSAGLQMFSSAWYWVALVINLLAGSLGWAGSVHGYLRSAQNQETTLRECFEFGLSKMIPVLVLTVLWWLGVALGFVLITVPGVILITMWSVAIPVLIGEDKGLLESFGRSRDLSRGHRWAIFGLLLLVLIVFYIAFAVILAAFVGGSAFAKLDMLNNLNPLAMIGSALVSWAIAMFLSALLSALYIELVEVNEGGRTGQLSDVFV